MDLCVEATISSNKPETKKAIRYSLLYIFHLKTYAFVIYPIITIAVALPLFLMAMKDYRLFSYFADFYSLSFLPAAYRSAHSVFAKNKAAPTASR